MKEVAQVGAVIGREFGHALLAAVAGLDERRLADALDQLVAAELVFRRGSPTEPLYAFKHALVQDAAYQSLLKSRRQQLHARVAEALEAGRAGEGEAPPEILAHHLTEAGLLARALPAWLAAGERAWRRSAYKEAIAHLRRGLEIASGVPAPEGRRAEIRLHTLLGVTLMAARGPRPEVIEAYERAARLAADAGETGELLRALWGSWFYCNLRADIPRARSIAADLLGRAGGTSDDGLLLQAHHAAWTTAWQGGDLREAREHAEAGLRLYDEARHHELTAFYGGHDAGACCRNTLGITLWLSGSPDRAAARAEEGVALARRLAHPFTLAITLAFGVLGPAPARRPGGDRAAEPGARRAVRRAGHSRLHRRRPHPGGCVAGGRRRGRGGADPGQHPRARGFRGQTSGAPSIWACWPRRTFAPAGPGGPRGRGGGGAVRRRERRALVRAGAAPAPGRARARSRRGARRGAAGLRGSARDCW